MSCSRHRAPRPPRPRVARRRPRPLAGSGARRTPRPLADSCAPRRLGPRTAAPYPDLTPAHSSCPLATDQFPPARYDSRSHGPPDSAQHARREARAARGAARRGSHRRPRQAREAPRAGPLHGTRAHRELLDEGSFQELDMFVRHRTTDFGMDKNRPLSDGVVNRPRHHRRPPRLRLLAGLHELRRLARRGHGREDVQGDGPRRQDRRPRHRHQRLPAAPASRKASSLLAGYGDVFLRNVRSSGVIPQITSSWALRRRRRVLARHHRLHRDGQEHEPHVHHRPRGHQDRHRRGRRIRRARRRDGPQPEVGRRRHFAWEDEDHALEETRYLFSFLRATTSSARRTSPPRTTRTARRPSSSTSSRQPQQAVRHARGDPRRRRRRGVSSRSTSTSPPTSSSASHAWRPRGRRRRQPADEHGRRPRHRRLRESRPLRPHLRRPSTSLSSPSATSPASSPAPPRNGTASSAAAPSSSTPSPKPPSRRSPSSPARPTVPYDVMASKHLGADMNFAWPTAEVAVMGPEGAVNIIYRNDLKNSPTPEERRQKLMDDYKARFANPYSAAERGYLDDVIEPSETRQRLCTALEALLTKHEPAPSASTGTSRSRGPQGPPRAGAAASHARCATADPRCSRATPAVIGGPSHHDSRPPASRRPPARPLERDPSRAPPASRTIRSSTLRKTA